MMVYLQLISGLALLLIGGEALVRGATGISQRLGLSALFIGMIVAGFGTSMPEMVVSVYATVEDQPAIAVGNVIGSNIANILLILGVAAMIRPIQSPPTLFRWDGTMLLAATAVVALLGLQGSIAAWQGAALIGALCAYLAFQYHRERRATGDRATASPAGSPAGGDAAVAAGGPEPRLAILVPLVLVGLAALIGGGNLFVEGAVGLARRFGIAEGLIGITVVAVGTSLPELATTLIAAWRRQSDLAYGNIIGSNLFNCLAILGTAAVAGQVEVAPLLAHVDGPVMVGATALMLCFMATARRMTRWEGAVLVGLYAVYIAVRATL